jgi:hypothetical protein
MCEVVECQNTIECRNCDYWYRIGGRSYEGKCRRTGNKDMKETLFNFSCDNGIHVKSSLTFQGVNVSSIKTITIVSNIII